MKKNKKILVTTVPFAKEDQTPLSLLERSGIDVKVNPIGRRLKPSELSSMIAGFDGMIAGTEVINRQVFKSASNLQIISRVGIGVDNLDLNEAEKRSIKVTYTPDAPAPAVAELTIGLMLSLLRHLPEANLMMHAGEWERFFGRRLSEVEIGIIGFGRIGQRVVRHLSGFAPKKVLINDIDQRTPLPTSVDASYVTKQEILERADLVTLHLPLSINTKNLLGYKELMSMKPDAALINTSRGGIINEHDLLEVLNAGHLSGVALDVFENEPYDGPLNTIRRCMLTSHMGSMSVDCRNRMEIEAAEEIVRHFSGEPALNLVPPSEYDVQRLKA